jgi:hypothetical protein
MKYPTKNYSENAGLGKHTIRHQCMNMWMQCHQVAEGLHKRYM